MESKVQKENEPRIIPLFNKNRHGPFTPLKNTIPFPSISPPEKLLSRLVFLRLAVFIFIPLLCFTAYLFYRGILLQDELTFAKEHQVRLEEQIFRTNDQNGDLRKNVSDFSAKYEKLIRENEALALKVEQNVLDASRAKQQSHRMEDLNQFLLQRIGEQEKELKILSFQLEEKLSAVKREMERDQEKLLAAQEEILKNRYTELLKQNQKPYYELYYESYESRYKKDQ